MEKFAVFFAFLSVSAASRTLPPNSNPNILHVSAAISKTQSLFSHSPRGILPSMHAVHHRKPAVSISSLSFDLHPRLSFRGTLEKNYKSLALSRLRRDSARVKAIHARLDLTPLEAEKLEGAVISGTSQGSGEYFSRVGVGEPPMEAYMVLDTGSDVSWVQCAPCADCYHQSDPIFDPRRSSSFTPLACDTQQCRSLDVSECRNDTCLYEVSYGDGSYTVGEFVTETVTFAGSQSVDDIAIGCGHNNEGLFVGAAGLIGLGGGKLSFPSQINATSFSYCLVDRDSASASTLDFNSPAPPGAVTAPLVRNPNMDTFYYVDLSGISVSGEMLPISPSTFKLNVDSGDGGVIVDSGTAVTRLQEEAYNAMRDAFRKGTAHLPAADGVALFDTCYDLSSRMSVEVPTVSFQFSNGKELNLPAKNYMIPVDSAGTFCFAFAATSSGLGIIGNVQQQGTRVTYDIANSLIGFSPNKC
ncbi:protein ASPARTIC PROTEASE IN GUARD CELL 1-like [Salvia divinorum]|uniref:Protein ASPARTIC PROTEASE IN GUARD CELL 1-like n=1 Tax=Salvia divinorum TaxID=28513 RepID=A0ABD1I877_SALDI